MDSKLRILVIGGHPADVFDHCGGTLSHHIQRGDQVTCLALTQGLRIHDEVISDKLRFGMNGMTEEELARLKAEREEVKYGEVKKACALFGITDVRFLGYDDKVLIVKEEMIVKIAKVIRDVRPHILITHYPLENGGVGSHHGNTGKNVMEAVMFAGSIDFDDPTPGWRVAQIFFMSPVEATIMLSYLSSQSRVYCDYYVDVTDVAELKVKALNAMRSQQYSGDYAKRETECWSGKDGHYMSVGYAESFITYKPEIGRYLQVSDELLEWANEPEKIRLARCSRMIAEFVTLDDE
jgi:4-oxalomesaconate hydratase